MTLACGARGFAAAPSGASTGSREAIELRDGDTALSIAVGTIATQIKTGSLCRCERVAKYNRLLVIEDELGANCSYAGRRR